jgi:hypothetical protein
MRLKELNNQNAHTCLIQQKVWKTTADCGSNAMSNGFRAGIGARETNRAFHPMLRGSKKKYMAGCRKDLFEVTPLGLGLHDAFCILADFSV